MAKACHLQLWSQLKPKEGDVCIVRSTVGVTQRHAHALCSCIIVGQPAHHLCLLTCPRLSAEIATHADALTFLSSLPGRSAPQKMLFPMINLLDLIIIKSFSSAIAIQINMTCNSLKPKPLYLIAVTQDFLRMNVNYVAALSTVILFHSL